MQEMQSVFQYPCLGKGRYGFEVTCEAAELYYDMRGSYNKVMNALHRRIGVKASHGVEYEFKSLPTEYEENHGHIRVKVVRLFYKQNI